MRTKIATLTTLACSVLLSACSSYQGNKLDQSGTYSDKVRGIPFQMTKPVFSVNITPNAVDATKADYTLSYDHVADANHRYTIALDPAFLTDGNFEFNFGPHGNLSNGNAALTSRTVAVMEAVAATALQFKNATRDAASVFRIYRLKVLATEGAFCKLTTSAPDAKVEVKVRDAIVARLDQLKARGDREAGRDKGAKTAFTEFHYLSETEKSCLADVHKDLKAVGDKDIDSAFEAYKKARKGVTDPRKMEIALLVAEVDGEGMQKLAEAIEKEAEGNDKLTSLAELASAALTYINAQDKQELHDVAFAFAYMRDRVWRARHVLHLERELQDKQVELLTTPTEKGPNTRRAKLKGEITALESERRATLGASDLYARMEKIDGFLSKIDAASGGVGASNRSPADEHIKLAAEHERLSGLIEKQRAELLAENNAPVLKKDKVTAKLNVPVPLVQRAFVDQFNDKSVTPSGAETPAFVLVLEPDTDTARLSTPVIAADTVTTGGK